MESNRPTCCFRHNRDISDQREQVGPSKSHHILLWLISSVMPHRLSPEISEFLNILEIVSTHKVTIKITKKEGPNYL